MKLSELAPVFRSKYLEAAADLAAARATKLRMQTAPEAMEMLSAVQAVVDSGAEPRHYAWFASSVYGLVVGQDSEEALVSVSNAVSPRVFTPEAASAFVYWYDCEKQRVAMALKVAEMDCSERMASGDSELRWLCEDCQEPVYRAEGLLRLLGIGGWKSDTHRARMVRSGVSRAAMAPGYDLDMFPNVKRLMRTDWATEVNMPAWAGGAR